MATNLATLNETSRGRSNLNISLTGNAFPVEIAAFLAVVSIPGVNPAGAYPEAIRLTAMTTAPFTLGLVSVSTLTAAVVETVRRVTLSANGRDLAKQSAGPKGPALVSMVLWIFRLWALPVFVDETSDQSL